MKRSPTCAAGPARDWADATSVLSTARRVIKEKQVAVDPQRWQCCMTPELLSLAKSGLDDEALEYLLDGLLGKYSNGKCSNIAECVSGGCQAKNLSSQDFADSGVNQDRMAQTAGG